MASVVRRTLRCSRAERAEIRERAAALGMSVSGYLVACALHEDAGGPRRDEPRLVLSEEQQLTLYQRVEEMDRVRRALGESLPGPTFPCSGRSPSYSTRSSRAGGQLMAERRATPRARLTISCLESEWERIREVAESRGVSINDHVISAGLNVELDPAQTDAPALALSEAEQRRLLDRVDRLAESMLSAASGGSIERLLQSVELLLMTTLHDLVWQGREHKLGSLLVAMFGPDDGPVVERQFREWMESVPPLLR